MVWFQLHLDYKKSLALSSIFGAQHVDLKSIVLAALRTSVRTAAHLPMIDSCDTHRVVEINLTPSRTAGYAPGHHQS